jgi:hypothetical protein
MTTPAAPSRPFGRGYPHVMLTSFSIPRFDWTLATHVDQMHVGYFMRLKETIGLVSCFFGMLACNTTAYIVLYFPLHTRPSKRPGYCGRQSRNTKMSRGRCIMQLVQLPVRLSARLPTRPPGRPPCHHAASKAEERPLRLAMPKSVRQAARKAARPAPARPTSARCGPQGRIEDAKPPAACQDARPRG